MAREAVLAAVRLALSDVQPAPSGPPGMEPIVAAPGPDGDRPALVERFTAQARAVGTVVHAARSRADAVATLARIATDAGAARVVAWPTPLASHAALALASASVAVRLVAPGAVLDAVAEADLGITEADALIAASGTLVLAAHSGARSVSLLPPVHVALVPAARAVPDLAAALRRAGRPDTCLTLVTGPSRTADIEKKLVVGVHGPCALHVVVVEQDEA